MSNNKYIIDKDSLTGIADVIRDKLGNGSSINDPAAGYYPDPAKSTFLAKFTTVGGRHQAGNQRYAYIAVCGMTAEDHVAAFGDTPCSYIKITSLGNPINASSSTSVTSDEFYVMPYFGDYGTKQKFNWTEGRTILIPVPSSYALTAPLAFMFAWQDVGHYKQNYDITAPEVQVEFLDENQNLMTSAIGSFSDYLSDWSAVSGSGDLTHTFEVEEIGYSPIPYSIEDMQDKIEDYWNPPTGSLNISSNGTYDVTTKVEAVVNVPNPSTGQLDIYANGIYDVTDKASANVYIQPPNLQTKQSVISSNGSQIILPDSGYDALNEVDLVVQVPNPSTGSLTINTNGTYDVTEKASAIVSVSPSLQTKTTTISQNGSQIITPDSNYDGLSAVNLTISVPNPSTGSLEITENGTYDVTDKASAIVNVPSSGGLPPFVVPTVKTKGLRWDVPGWSDFSSIFPTQEEMLEHLIDILIKDQTATGEIAGQWITAPVFKDEYGRWIPLKMMGVTLPKSFSIGSQWTSLGLTNTVIQNLYNNNLVFGCSSKTTYITSGGVWYIIWDRYVIGCTENYVGLHSNWSYVLYTEA